jgi:hypothetical protein
MLAPLLNPMMVLVCEMALSWAAKAAGAQRLRSSNALSSNHAWL